MKNRVRIYYLGAGHISIPVLESLLASEYVELCGVGSQKKEAKCHGGAARSAISPLAKYCNAKGWNIELHPSVNTPEFRGMLRERGVEMLVVASYGQILKQELLDTPPCGCLNVHASLLPKYRGAAPIVAALLAGETEAGVSFMQMEAGLDTGPVYRAVKLAVTDLDTAWTLEERLGVLAGEHIGRCIYEVAREGLPAIPQPAEGASYAGKISKLDGQVNWEESAEKLQRKVRALQPWPGLRAVVPCRGGDGKKNVKITEALAIAQCPEGAMPGEILAYGKDGILVACGNGALRIKRVIPEGKREMSAADYLLGSPIPADRLAMVSPAEPQKT